MAVEKLRTELEAQHQASVIKLKALWSREKETEIQQQVASAKAAWQEELQKVGLPTLCVNFFQLPHGDFSCHI